METFTPLLKPHGQVEIVLCNVTLWENTDYYMDILNTVHSFQYNCRNSRINSGNQSLIIQLNIGDNNIDIFIQNIIVWNHLVLANHTSNTSRCWCLVKSCCKTVTSQKYFMIQKFSIYLACPIPLRFYSYTIEYL